MPPNALAEIVLVARHFDASLAFYRDALALPLEREPGGGWAWFLLGDPHAGRPQRLALAPGNLLYEERSPRADLPDGARLAGPMHFALHIDRKALPAALDRLAQHNVEVFGPERFDWMCGEGRYCYDPEGNLVELWTPLES